MLDKSEIADLLGEERTWEGRIGFIHAEVEKGLEIKDLNDRGDYFYCFDYKFAVKEYGEEEADKMFRSRLEVIRTHKDLDMKLLNQKCYRCNGGGSNLPCVFL